MPRRIAFALALAFTTIVTFALFAMGANAGFFSDAKKKATTQDAQAYEQQDDLAGALQYLAATGASQAQPEPQIITDYVYVYETPIPDVTYVLRRGNPQVAATRSQPQQQQPATTSPAAPTPAPAGAAPTSVPVSATPPIAAPTQPAAASPTAPAPAPTDTPAPAQPPANAANCPKEFKSTVTAIEPVSQGQSVTWANAAVTLVVPATPGGSKVQVGGQFAVHAKLLSIGCTAIEIG